MPVYLGNKANIIKQIVTQQNGMENTKIDDIIYVLKNLGLPTYVSYTRK